MMTVAGICRYATAVTMVVALSSGASAWAERVVAVFPLDGYLERGPVYSKLLEVSPESGDLVAYVFANTSRAGLELLGNCLPDMRCTVSAARVLDLGEEQIEDLQLDWVEGVSAMFLVEQVQDVSMQSALPFYESALETRFGWLNVNEEEMLLFKGQPVLETVSAAAAEAPPPAAEEGLLEQIRRRLQHSFQRIGLLSGPEDDADGGVSQGAAQIVQGNTALRMVAAVALDDSDAVLLQSTGGTACPALYRFATLTAGGITVTPEFGTCSDLASIRADEDDQQALIVSMPDFLGPSEPETRAMLQKREFRLRSGAVTEMPTLPTGQ